MNKLLKVTNLSVFMGGTKAAIVRDVSFSMHKGQSLIILGQSGSGKTMTCKAILGILGRPFQATGSIDFSGVNLIKLTGRRRRSVYGSQIALIAQNPMTAFNPSARVGKQMEETLRIHTGLPHKQAKEKCLCALEQAGLVNGSTVFESYPHMLSGGMLQRVMIAMTLMTDARLVVADEPTTALDVAHRKEAVDSFIRLRERGTAILLVTHDLAVAARLGGHLLIMKDGEIVERGELAAVLASPRHPYTKTLISAARLSDEHLIRSESYAGGQRAEKDVSCFG